MKQTRCEGANVCPNFAYVGDTDSGGGVVEAARARVRCAWAKFKSSLYVRGASYRIMKGSIVLKCFDIWTLLLGQ